MGLDSHEPRGRLARYLRRQYAEGHATKRLARDINSTTKTAENILNGSWPSSRHLGAIIARFGRDVTEAVFHPEDAVERLHREAEEYERLSAERRAMAAEMAGAAPRRARGLASPENRPAEVIRDGGSR